MGTVGIVSLAALSVLLGVETQYALIILSAMEDLDDDHLGPHHAEDDRCPPFEAHRSKAGANVVACSTPLGKGFERETRRFNAVDIAAGHLVARVNCDASIEFEEICFGLRPKDDLKSSHAARPWPAAHGDRGAS